MLLDKYKKVPNLIVEKGEYVKDKDGRVTKVSPKMPSHDDTTLVGIKGDKKVKKGKGGIELENITQVISGTQENRRQKDSTYSDVDESIKFDKEEARIFLREKFKLQGKIKSSMSPAKVLDKSLEARDAYANRFKNLKQKPHDKFAENSLLANKAQLAALPSLEDMFDTVFAEQEKKK